MIKINMLLAIVFFLFVNCEDNNPILSGGGDGDGDGSGDNDNKSGWLIPKDEVIDGGPGKDGIPALSNPEFVTAAQADFLEPDDLVLGIKSRDIVRAYPHIILDWHEIINDEVQNKKVAVTYCPLTGTGIGWDRVLNGNETTFGVSGLLYNTNLIPYDRTTDSYWSQIGLNSVHGELIGTEARTYHLVETTWKTWKEMYPKTQVASLNTGFSRSYGNYPYGNYKTSNSLIFSVDPRDERLDLKERVHGIIVENEAMVLRFETFAGDKNKMVQTSFKNNSIVAIGNEDKNFIVSFINKDNKKFTPIELPGEGVFKDNDNNIYNVFGEIIEGPDAGSELEPTTSFMGFWFSFGAFYPKPEIYGSTK
jgi:hypothetical protein